MRQRLVLPLTGVGREKRRGKGEGWNGRNKKERERERYWRFVDEQVERGKEKLGKVAKVKENHFSEN